MLKVLVIGGNGFIGKNVVCTLNENNIETGIYDVFSNCEAHQYKGDIINDDNFREIISNYDCIIYLITNTSVGKSMDDPGEVYNLEVSSLLKTLDSCLESGVKRVIFSSSGGTVYGENNGLPSKESDFEQPINHYAICKLTCEKILLQYNKLHCMENVVLRISNPYGRWQNPKSQIGVITAFVNQIANNKPINIFGDGSIARDFIDIESVAKAFYLAAIWNFNSEITPIFNIGSGETTSINQIIELITEATQIEPSINYLPRREFDVEINLLDLEKSKKYLKYVPSADQNGKMTAYISTIYNEVKSC